jgi:hypothetical protein
MPLCRNDNATDQATQYLQPEDQRIDLRNDSIGETEEQPKDQAGEPAVEREGCCANHHAIAKWK